MPGGEASELDIYWKQMRQLGRFDGTIQQTRRCPHAQIILLLRPRRSVLDRSACAVTAHPLCIGQIVACQNGDDVPSRLPARWLPGIFLTRGAQDTSQRDNNQTCSPKLAHLACGHREAASVELVGWKGGRGPRSRLQNPRGAGRGRTSNLRS